MEAKQTIPGIPVHPSITTKEVENIFNDALAQLEKRFPSRDKFSEYLAATKLAIFYGSLDVTNLALATFCQDPRLSYRRTGEATIIFKNGRVVKTPPQLSHLVGKTVIEFVSTTSNILYVSKLPGSAFYFIESAQFHKPSAVLPSSTARMLAASSSSSSSSSVAALAQTREGGVEIKKHMPVPKVTTSFSSSASTGTYLSSGGPSLSTTKPPRDPVGTASASTLMSGAKPLTKPSQYPSGSFPKFSASAAPSSGPSVPTAPPSSEPDSVKELPADIPEEYSELLVNAMLLPQGDFENILDVVCNEFVDTQEDGDGLLSKSLILLCFPGEEKTIRFNCLRFNVTDDGFEVTHKLVGEFKDGLAMEGRLLQNGDFLRNGIWDTEEYEQYDVRQLIEVCRRLFGVEATYVLAPDSSNPGGDYILHRWGKFLREHPYEGDVSPEPPSPTVDWREAKGPVTVVSSEQRGDLSQSEEWRELEPMASLRVSGGEGQEEAGPYEPFSEQSVVEKEEEGPTSTEVFKAYGYPAINESTANTLLDKVYQKRRQEQKKSSPSQSDDKFWDDISKTRAVILYQRPGEVGPQHPIYFKYKVFEKKKDDSVTGKTVTGAIEHGVVATVSGGERRMQQFGGKSLQGAMSAIYRPAAGKDPGINQVYLVTPTATGDNQIIEWREGLDKLRHPTTLPPVEDLIKYFAADVGYTDIDAPTVHPFREVSEFLTVDWQALPNGRFRELVAKTQIVYLYVLPFTQDGNLSFTFGECKFAMGPKGREVCVTRKTEGFAQEGVITEVWNHDPEKRHQTNELQGQRLSSALNGLAGDSKNTVLIIVPRTIPLQLMTIPQAYGLIDEIMASGLDKYCNSVSEYYLKKGMGPLATVSETSSSSSSFSSLPSHLKSPLSGTPAKVGPGAGGPVSVHTQLGLQEEEEDEEEEENEKTRWLLGKPNAF